MCQKGFKGLLKNFAVFKEFCKPVERDSLVISKKKKKELIIDRTSLNSLDGGVSNIPDMLPAQLKKVFLKVQINIVSGFKSLVVCLKRQVN